MNISNNTLAAFNAGVSTIKEDRQVLNEMTCDDLFFEMLDTLESIDALSELKEIRNEFNESVDDFSEFNEYNSNIK